MDKKVDFYVHVVFVQPNGEREVVRDRVGKSLMDFAVDHGVKGIDAQCGGACICTTCMCSFSVQAFAELARASCDELEMLSYTPARKATSRLACQVKVTQAMEGLEVYID